MQIGKYAKQDPTLHFFMEELIFVLDFKLDYLYMSKIRDCGFTILWPLSRQSNLLNNPIIINIANSKALRGFENNISYVTMRKLSDPIPTPETPLIS